LLGPSVKLLKSSEREQWADSGMINRLTEIIAHLG